MTFVKWWCCHFSFMSISLPIISSAPECKTICASVQDMNVSPWMWFS